MNEERVQNFQKDEGRDGELLLNCENLSWVDENVLEKDNVVGSTI